MLGVGSFALCVLACQLLGVLAAVIRARLLTSGNLVILLAVLAAVLRAFSLSRQRRSTGPDEPSHVDSSRRPPGDLRAGFTSLTAGVRAAGAGPFLGVLLLSLASLASGVVLGLSGPPRGWDVMTYHLPRAVAWLQHGNLGHYGFSPAFYPGNGEVAILVTLFSG
jgi:hypothetical protein